MKKNKLNENYYFVIFDYDIRFFRYDCKSVIFEINTYPTKPSSFLNLGNFKL